MTLDAALIAGGKSRRFGRDKAFVDWAGEPLWIVQLRKLLEREDVERVWLSSNAEQPFPDHIDGVTRLDDVIPDIGPMGALKTVFEASDASHVLIIAVDMPRLEVGSMVPGVTRIGDRWEPLAGIYPRGEMLELIDARIETGDYALQSLLDEAEAKGIIAPLPPEDPGDYANVNTAEDLEAIQEGDVAGRTLLRRYLKGVGYGEAEFDHLAGEEPLEVRVNGQSVSVMMRTPGHDEELAIGFLYTEGVIESAAEIVSIELSREVSPSKKGNTLEANLSGERDLSELTRHVFTSSSCGVCGKATIDSVFQSFAPLEKEAPPVDPEVILTLPSTLREHQATFDKTGGLHASALFRQDGELVLLREDVGRHNALDKVIGHGVREGLDFGELILLVSGRISFELMQKSLSVQIPVVAGISAPSSLAVDLAGESGQVLIGFLRESRFNLYSGGR